MGIEILGSRVVGTQLIVETADGEVTYDTQFLVAALLIYVARGSGQIEPEESALIIDLIEDKYDLGGAEAFDLITHALTELDDKKALRDLLLELAPNLSDEDKQDIALMGLRVVAADGQREFAELEQFNKAMAVMGISPDIVHHAFDIYFEQTLPGK